MTGKKHYSILDDFGDSARQPSVIEPAETNEVAKPNDRVALSGEIGHRAVRLVITRDSSGSEKIEADFKGYESDEFLKVLNSARTITGSGGARAIERAGADELPTHSQDTQVSGLRRYRDSSTRGSGPDFVSDNTEFVPRPVQGTVVNGSRNYEDDDYRDERQYDQSHEDHRLGTEVINDKLDEYLDEEEPKGSRRLRKAVGSLAATVVLSYASLSGIHAAEHDDYTFVQSVLDPGSTLEPLTDMQTLGKMKSQVTGLIKWIPIG